MSRGFLIGKIAFAGVALFVALGVLAWRVHANTLWSLRGALRVTAPSPSNDGKWVIATGAIGTEEPVGDPDFVLPEHYVVLERVVEELTYDSDDGLQWKRRDALGPIRGARFAPKSARVGDGDAGFRLAMDAADYMKLPSLALRASDIRTEWDKPGIAQPKWDEKRGSFLMTSDLLPGASLTLPASGGAPEVTNVGGAVSFQGFAQGQRVQALGVQRGESLVPGVLRAGERPRLLVAPVGLDDLVLAEEERWMGGAEVALGFGACLALLLIFSHPFGIVRFVMYCGIGDVLACFFEVGFVAGVLRLVLTIVALAAPLATYVVAQTLPSIILVLGCVLVFSLAMVLLRLTKGLEETETEQSQDDF